MKSILKAIGSVAIGGLLLFSVAGQTWALVIMFIAIAGISIAYNWSKPKV